MKHVHVLTHVKTFAGLKGGPASIKLRGYVEIHKILFSDWLFACYDIIKIFGGKSALKNRVTQSDF